MEGTRTISLMPTPALVLVCRGPWLGWGGDDGGEVILMVEEMWEKLEERSGGGDEDEMAGGDGGCGDPVSRQRRDLRAMASKGCVQCLPCATQVWQ